MVLVRVQILLYILQLPPQTLVELRRFFEDYKKLENKDVIMEKFMNKEIAYNIIKESIERYENNKKELIGQKDL